MSVKIRKTKKFFLPLALLLLAVFVSLAYNSKKDADKELSVYAYPLVVSFIDVGQGDCELLQCENYNILIDGGEKEQASTVNAYLKSRGVEKIDAYILTHPHSDHIGAAQQIISSNKVERVFMTVFSELNIPTTKTYENTLDAIDKYGAEFTAVTAGKSYSFGNLTLNILSPSHESDDYNDMSIIVKAIYKNSSFLFTGDATKASEQELLENNADINADVLKIAHHGSSTSTSEQFLLEVSPEIAVISYGEGNSYGHPHDEVIHTLEDNNIEYYTTAKNGTIVIASDGKRLYSEVEK